MDEKRIENCEGNETGKEREEKEREGKGSEH